MTETIYSKGIYLKEQPTQYGNIYKVSVKLEDFIEWAGEHVNEKGYVNIDFQAGKKGDLYGKLNTWVKK